MPPWSARFSVCAAILGTSKKSPARNLGWCAPARSSSSLQIKVLDALPASSVLDKALVKRYALATTAGWSSQAARWAHNPKVAGSNPAPATQKVTELRGVATGYPFLL